MPRNRVIQSEYPNNEKLAEISRDARLLFIYMWIFSDDYGVIKGHDVWLKSVCFPYEKIEQKEFRKLLDELMIVEVVIPFNHNGSSFYVIRDWKDHQKIDRPSFKRNPEPPKDLLEKWSKSARRKLVESSLSNRIELNENIIECNVSKKEFSDEIKKFSDFLFECIRKNNPNFKGDPRKWDSDFDKMIRIDKRDSRNIVQVIIFCQSNDFWKSNILSGAKLRKQFDQLFMKAGNETEKNNISITV